MQGKFSLKVYQSLCCTLSLFYEKGEKIEKKGKKYLMVYLCTDTVIQTRGTLLDFYKAENARLFFELN